MHLPVPHAAPEFSSSEWIAHNASLRAKRSLLRGPRPKIGSPYVPPASQITPAVEIYPPEKPTWWEIIGWAIALPGFIAVMITLGWLGGF